MASNATTPGSTSERLRRLWSSSLVGVVLAWIGTLLAIPVVRILEVDTRLVASAIRYQAADLPVHRRTDHSILNYELAPRTSLTDQGPYGEYRVTINSQGFRGPERPIARTPETLRVLAIGCSTLYGSGVDDDQTLAVAFERELGERLGIPVEVWNRGTPGYNLEQIVDDALRFIDRVDPDLVLLQHYNTGPRHHLMPESWAERRAVARRVWRDDVERHEQFPAVYPSLEGIHRRAFRRDPMYRAIAALARRAAPERLPHTTLLRMERAALTLASEAADREIPVLLLLIPELQYSRPLPGLAPEWTVDLEVLGHPDVEDRVHPPPPFLDSWGRHAAAAAVDRGLLDAAVADHYDLSVEPGLFGPQPDDHYRPNVLDLLGLFYLAWAWVCGPVVTAELLWRRWMAEPG